MAAAPHTGAGAHAADQTAPQGPAPGPPAVPVAGPLRYAGALRRAHDGAVVAAAAFSPTAPLLATAAGDGSIRIWRLGPNLLAKRPPSAEEEDDGAEGEDDDGPEVAGEGAEQQRQAGKDQEAAAKPPRPARRGPPSAPPAAELVGHATGVNALAWSPSGVYLASAGDDTTVRVWEIIQTPAVAGEAAASEAAAAGGDDGDAPPPPPPLVSSSCALILRGHTHHVFCVAFSPAGNTLASGAFDETLRVWDVRTGRCLRDLPAHGDPLTGARFSPDGTAIASCSYDGLARLWNAATGRCLRTFAGGDRAGAAAALSVATGAAAPVAGVALSPNGLFLLEATLDARLRLVDVRTGRVVREYEGHVARDFCCAGIGFMELGGTSGGGRAAVGGAGTDDGADGGADGGAGDSAAAVAGREDGGWAMWGVDSCRVLQRVVGKAGRAPAAAADAAAAAAAVGRKREAGARGRGGGDGMEGVEGEDCRDGAGAGAGVETEAPAPVNEDDEGDEKGGGGGGGGGGGSGGGGGCRGARREQQEEQGEGHRGPTHCVDWRRGGLCGLGGAPATDDGAYVALCTAGADGHVRFWVGEA